MHYGSILCGATPRRNWEAPARCCGTRWDAAWPASCVRWSGHHKTVRTWNAGFIVWNLQWKTSFVIYNDSEAIFIHSKCACKVSISDDLQKLCTEKYPSWAHKYSWGHAYVFPEHVGWPHGSAVVAQRTKLLGSKSDRYPSNAYDVGRMSVRGRP